MIKPLFKNCLLVKKKIENSFGIILNNTNDVFYKIVEVADDVSFVKVNDEVIVDEEKLLKIDDVYFIIKEDYILGVNR